MFSEKKVPCCFLTPETSVVRNGRARSLQKEGGVLRNSNKEVEEKWKFRERKKGGGEVNDMWRFFEGKPFGKRHRKKWFEESASPSLFSCSLLFGSALCAHTHRILLGREKKK